MSTLILKGNICYSKTKETLAFQKQGYLVCKDGISQGVFQTLPEEYAGCEIKDYGNRMIIPGLVDLHVHAPQYTYRGLGMDLELIDWLDTNTFPEEAKYADVEYAKKAYQIFVNDLAKSTTTRACIFATIHKDATDVLMGMLEETGLHTFVGKVNMDRNSPDYLRENSVEEVADQTRSWVENSQKKYQHTYPILTPRFTPSCTDACMQELSKIQKEYHVAMQSHLSENLGEIAWVQELCPTTRFYGEAYSQHDLFGGSCPTLMAHCVYSKEEEIALMKENGVFVVHCPTSNTNISSGIAPVRMYLEENLKMGLGSDVAGGHSLEMFDTIVDTIQVSKLRWRLIDQTQKALTIDEAFYLATKGGGEFFGKVGSFEEGYEFDAVVMDDSNLPTPRELTLKERLERLVYLGDDRNIVDKYVCGEQITLS